MLVQEVWQKKKVGVGGEVEEESGMQTFSLGQSTWKPVLRETQDLEGITGEKEIKRGVGR